MNVLGNIFLCIATLIIFYLVTSFYAKSMPGGDAGVGYAWGIITLNVAFFVCMVIVALIVGWKGGFEWISASKSTRTLFAILGVLLTLLYVAFCGFIKADSGIYPGPVRFLINFSYPLLPIIVIIISAILLNDSLKNAIPAALFKWPSIFVTIVSLAGFSTYLIHQMIESATDQAARLESNAKVEDENTIRILGEIDTCDVLSNMGAILSFTDGYQTEIIKTAAIVKIKTNPDWEKELLHLMDSNYGSEVFQFLSSNDVDDPSLFEVPIHKAILHMAEIFSQTIRDASQPHHLYADQFLWEVDRVIRTVDRFQCKEIDYVPAMKEMRASLNEPAAFEKPKFRCIPILDRWIKAHS